MFEEMFKDEESASSDHGVRLACADESVFSALARYYSHVEEYESLCGMPVRLFYPEVEQEQSISLDVVSWRNTMLIPDVQVKSIPPEVLKEQDVICVYRTDSEENFIACAERLTALQEDGSDQCARPAVLCFADADSAKAYVCGSGLWAPRQSQVVRHGMMFYRFLYRQKGICDGSREKFSRGRRCLCGTAQRGVYS